MEAGGLQVASRRLRRAGNMNKLPLLKYPHELSGAIVRPETAQLSPSRSFSLYPGMPVVPRSILRRSISGACLGCVEMREIKEENTCDIPDQGNNGPERQGGREEGREQIRSCAPLASPIDSLLLPLRFPLLFRSLWMQARCRPAGGS